MITKLDDGSGEGASGVPVVLTPIAGAPVDGDLLVAAVLLANPGAGTRIMTPPADWTTLQSFDTGPAYWLGYTFWHAGDPTSHTWQGTQPFVVVFEAFRGVDETIAPSSGIRIADVDLTSFESIHFVEGFVDPHRTYLYVAAALTYGQSSGLTPRAPLVAGVERGTTAGGRFTALDPPHSDGLDALLAHRTRQVVDGDDGPYYIDGLETHTEHGPIGVQTQTDYVDVANVWATSSAVMTAPTGGDFGANGVRILLAFDLPFGRHIDLDSIGVIDQVTGLNLLAEDESTFETGISANWEHTGILTLTQGSPTTPYEGTHSLRALAGNSNGGSDLFFDRDLTVVPGRDYLFTVTGKAELDPGEHVEVRLDATWLGDQYTSFHQPENLDALFVSLGPVLVASVNSVRLYRQADVGG